MIDLKALPKTLKVELSRGIESGSLTAAQAVAIIKEYQDREARKAPRRTAFGFSGTPRGTGNLRRGLAKQGFKS